MGPDGYRLDRIGPEMYAVTAAPGVQAAFVVSSAGVIVVDAPPPLATALPAAIRKVTEKPVTHLIYTHQHADHIANARVFGDVVRVAHAETARLIHRLGAVDVFTRENIQTIALSHVIDAPHDVSF